MITRHQMQERDEFIESHGHHVLIDGQYLFSDGARVDEDPMGQMFLPPEDPYEKAQLISQYWLVVSTQDELHFNDFKNYLNGTGKRQDAWAVLWSDEERIKHLKQLQQQAKKSRARCLKANRSVRENRPFWMDEREQQEAEEEQRKQTFLSMVDQINL